MNLREHKALLWQHEQSLLELDRLIGAQDHVHHWFISTASANIEIPIPTDYAKEALQAWQPTGILLAALHHLK